MKKNISKLIVILVLLVTACTKVINVDLNDKSGQYVIECEITDQQAPYYVKISKSGAFSSDNSFEKVNNAIVVISDNSGITDTLSFVANGIYSTHSITGTPGNTYQLKVTIGSSVYTAQSTMPEATAFDTLAVYDDAGVNVLMTAYMDNGLQKNFYRFKTLINGKPASMISIFDDKLNNGLFVMQPLYGKIKSGDEVTVSMQCIDQSVYNYFYGLSEISGMGESATPANPVSNIHGGSLGYFSAHTVQSRTIIVP